ncbi:MULTISPECIES: LLM class flavin-dependent oxidoreductase [unclassified Knoellia]|uniref:LLM class flavin-dependent oxidoreductase n=1 Tax=Knoellia altitudinis TaxID=3404795 RepID=UPI00361683FB
MRHGLSVPCFGAGLDAAMVAVWARDAEDAGWDGFFLWDHLFAFTDGPVDTIDPFIALTAAACATRSIRLGTLVTPLPRRRPLVVARQSVTLDRLSGGRLVLGVGTGSGPFEWDFCGEEADPVLRGDMLDEHLDLLSRLWTGQPVRHEGRFYTVAGPDWSGLCHPPPLQQPRIPVWVGGSWPGTRPFTRAARWDGVVPMRVDGSWSVADTAAVAQRMRSLRGTTDSHFDVAVPGESDPTDPGRTERFAEHADAGATWWVEAIHPWRYGDPDKGEWNLAAMHERIVAGP